MNKEAVIHLRLGICSERGFMMDDPLAMYKAFIDGLVQRSTSAEGVRMKERILYDVPPVEIQERDKRRGYSEAVAAYERFRKYNQFVEDLSDEQRLMIADLLQSEKEAGMAEVLAFLADGKYQLTQNGSVLPFEPFDTSYHYDFAARVAGDGWPDEASK